MFIYLVMNIAVFSIILSLKKSDAYVEKISSLSGLSKSNPVISASLAIIMLSMAGIPPFIGFLENCMYLLQLLKVNCTY